MKKTSLALAIILTALLTALFVTPVWAETTANSSASTQAQSAAANMGVQAIVKSYGSAIPDETTSWVFNNPATVTPGSSFGWSPSNCGGSDSKTVGLVVGSYGESTSKPMFDCNVRQDSTMAWKMGLHRVAVLRMFCFGSGANRMAFEAAGNACPSSGTAKGIPGAPVVSAIAPRVKRGHINADGTVTWGQK